MFQNKRGEVMQIVSVYGEKPVRPKLDCGSESMTQQHFKRECDINYILRGYNRTGLIDHVNRYQGQYMDLSEPVDFLTAQNVVIDAVECFESLPAAVRKRFKNDPQGFLEFVQNPENKEEMQEMGLLKPEKPEQKPIEVTVVGGNDEE
jgi:phage internal scaffolding protein